VTVWLTDVTVYLSDGNDNEYRMDDIVADIGRGYGLESTDLPPEVQNFYRFLIALEEKVHDDIDVNVLKAVTHLMTFKLKYNFSNQYYNNIVKLIIDLISAKHNIPKDFIIYVGYMYKGRASHARHREV
jgi:hypothetical protein